MSQTKACEDETRRLKKMFTEFEHAERLVQGNIKQNRAATSTPRDDRGGSCEVRGQHCCRPARRLGISPGSTRVIYYNKCELVPENWQYN